MSEKKSKYGNMIDLLQLQKQFILNHLGEGDTAVDFTVDAIKISAADPDLPRYGVRFEAALPGLIKNL